MDWQRIKERVTEEVLRQLQTNGATGASSPVGSNGEGASGGTVLTATASVNTVGPGFRTDVLVVMAGPVSDLAIETIRIIGSGRAVAIVAGRDVGNGSELAAIGTLFTAGDHLAASHLVGGAGTIIVPALSLGSAAKITNLVGDDLATAVLVQAALTGKKPIVAQDGLVLPTSVGWAVRSKAGEIVGALRSFGFDVTDLAGLAAKAGKALGPVPQTAVVHPAVVASRAARAEVAVATPEGNYDRELARMIDHTLLKPEATADQITKLCSEAAAYQFISVCVNPTWVPLSARLLQRTPVKVCTVIGFPLGTTSSQVKAFETAHAIAQGATEVDMVLNVGALKSGQFDVVLSDVRAVVDAARGKALVKVILETGLLTDDEKVKACELCKQAGADFVKTSTGFGPGGATAADIALMRRTVGPTLGVKASGGIRDYDTAMAMVTAGANRIGASASVNIVNRVEAQPAGGKEKY